MANPKGAKISSFQMLDIGNSKVIPDSIGDLFSDQEPQDHMVDGSSPGSTF